MFHLLDPTQGPLTEEIFFLQQSVQPRQHLRGIINVDWLQTYLRMPILTRSWRITWI